MQQLVFEGNKVKKRSKEKGEIKLENNMLCYNHFQFMM